MAETFKVGDTVSTNVANVSVGTIAFGPFKATEDGPKRYMVQAQNGTAHSLLAAELRPYVIFAVGETVTESAMGTTVTVEAGPFAGLGGHDFYVIKRRNGVHSWIKSTMLQKRPVVTIQDAVRKMADDMSRAVRAGGFPQTFEYVPGNSRAFTFRGRTYRLDAEYADSQGDVWKFNGRTDDAGNPLMDCPLHPTLSDYTVQAVLQHFGPLSRA